MKKIKIITLVLFFAVVVLPVVFFNFEANAISEIDNRVLTENPFRPDAEGDLTGNIESYVNDRVGLRREMILSYTWLNDKVFGKMTHPSYSYGKEGYVFGAGVTTSGMFSQFHVTFADMVLELQQYCEARDIPFLFVFEPAKPAVLSEYLHDGINYSRDWVDLFFRELEQRGINYLDNTAVLQEVNDRGIAVFNPKYDANHWNDIGAYYGTEAILQRMQQMLPDTYVNSLSDFKVEEDVMEYLPVSLFPIHETVPKISLNTPYTKLTGNYTGLARHPSYPAFGYYVNEQRLAEGSPKALVFQGSYMNEAGYKFMINALGEYIHVHDYQNVIDLPYYFNIFKPDCVIFEVAEYTFAEHYFDPAAMEAIDYNQPLAAYGQCSRKDETLAPADIAVETGETLTKLEWLCGEEADYAWLLLDDEYDMKKTERGYEVTVPTEAWRADGFCIVTYRDGVLSYYR